MKDAKHCSGCRENFYNGHNPYGIGKCWSLDGAKLVTKYQLSTSTPMNIRSAYLQVRVPDCYRAPGYVHLDKIPEYAQ